MMNNKKISSLEFSILMIFPILSLFSGIGLSNILKAAKIDAYLSIVLTTILGFLILIILKYILDYEEELTLPEKNIKLFGKPLGFIINILIDIVLLFAAIVLTYNINNFIVSQFLTETPIFIILTFLGLTALYSISKGIETIARTSIIFFIIITVLTIISTAGIIPYFELSNLKPFLEKGINPSIKAAFSIFIINILPIIGVLIIPKKDIVHKQDLLKKMIIFYLIAMTFLFSATILTIGCLGINLIKIFPHPEYMVLEKISFLGFIDRIENVIYVKWLLNDFICFEVIVYYISNSIKKQDKQKLTPFIIIIIINSLSQLLFKDNTEFEYFIYNIYPFINLTLFILLILITFMIFIKKKRRSPLEPLS